MPPVSAMLARNQRLCLGVLAGKSLAQLASQEGITRARVSEIFITVTNRIRLSARRRGWPALSAAALADGASIVQMRSHACEWQEAVQAFYDGPPGGAERALPARLHTALARALNIHTRQEALAYFSSGLPPRRLPGLGQKGMELIAEWLEPDLPAKTCWSINSKNPSSHMRRGVPSRRRFRPPCVGGLQLSRAGSRPCPDRAVPA